MAGRETAMITGEVNSLSLSLPPSLSPSLHVVVMLLPGASSGKSPPSCLVLLTQVCCCCCCPSLPEDVEEAAASHLFIFYRCPQKPQTTDKLSRVLIPIPFYSPLIDPVKALVKISGAPFDGTPSRAAHWQTDQWGGIARSAYCIYCVTSPHTGNTEKSGYIEAENKVLHHRHHFRTVLWFGRLVGRLVFIRFRSESPKPVKLVQVQQPRLGSLT